MLRRDRAILDTMKHVGVPSGWRAQRPPRPEGIKPHPPDETGYTVAEFAARHRVVEYTVRRWIREGMPTVQPGGFKGRHVIYESEVEQWARMFRCIGAAQGHDASSNIDRDTQPEPNGNGHDQAATDGAEAVS